MKKRIRNSVICLFLICGVVLLLYPKVMQGLYEREAKKTIENFEIVAEALSEAPDFGALYARMQQYNADLYANGQSGFKDAWSYQEPSFDLRLWGFEDQMIGYVEVPQMEVKLPLYLGANDDQMKKGAVHLTETSLPVGGAHTNSVIAAHRGYSRAAMFRDIEVLQRGDSVYVTNLWETLEYKVTETKVIRPNEISEVLIRPGRDLVTLITCHPYGYNYKRYVVYCERVD